MRKKGQIGWDTLVPWIIGIIVLALVIVFYGILTGKGEGALEFFSNIFRFG